ncbi:unnamed protein product [Ranitomeya imitator]|uniref:Fibronectin type-III domain-containing protein n=1 Tax=Ranitomeya imitator TaxID=111125 RepID=A0ABN9L5U3_9NEOB|nr:unnamed protein product [Ranitomeya imitator]
MGSNVIELAQFHHSFPPHCPDTILISDLGESRGEVTVSPEPHLDVLWGNGLIPEDTPWSILFANMDPTYASFVVRNLIPARSYQFRLCAVNDVGKGQFSKETQRVTLPEEPPSAAPQHVLATGRTNQSIMIQWQSPPENHQNGVLKGYVISLRMFCFTSIESSFDRMLSAHSNSFQMQNHTPGIHP